MTSVRALARLEREEFADLLEGLTPQQWATPSLCDGWSVRDVATHTIAYLGQSRTRLLINMIRARGDVDRINADQLQEQAGRSPARLVELMRQRAEPSGAAALYRGRVGLIECLIHQQDIRRPLKQPRSIPEDRLQVSLDYARVSPIIGGARRTRRVRLVATDMDWSAGHGPEARGTGEALLLAMTGRAELLDELDGEGVTLLR
ncbi:maleylpyruvate isomerase family mycothiol-dependent enzyme [Mycolicibacterium sp. 624]|uniref:maleylpyruvate isomerase family mycothiol-dependent enzyme n=1 Tax=Mycolicibacterium sp. 624 TaxID=3156314 RepID=UPI0033928ABC